MGTPETTSAEALNQVYIVVLPHAEWGIVGFACFSEPEALKSWWRSQVWILLVIQWILFAPTMYLVGMGEEVRPRSCLPGRVNVNSPSLEVPSRVHRIQCLMRRSSREQTADRHALLID